MLWRSWELLEQDTAPVTAVGASLKLAMKECEARGGPRRLLSWELKASETQHVHLECVQI